MKNPWFIPASFARRFHRDTHGALGVLLLLVMWALVCIIGLLWNTAEYAVRRRQMQTGADAIAHDGANWIARTTNSVCANNMMICQDAAAEVIWRTVPPTDQTLTNELTNELLLAQQDPTLKSRLPGLLRAIETNYQLLAGALNSIDFSSISFPDAATAAAYKTKVRQTGLALGWIESTYVHGVAPGVAGWPGPPGPGGLGLQELVDQWAKDTALTDRMRAAIINSIHQQQAVLTQFEQRTAPATSQDIPGKMAQHEQQLFAAEAQIKNSLSAIVESERQRMAAFYKVNATFATPNAPTNAGAGDTGSPGNAGDNPPVQIAAPVNGAAEVEPVTGHVDSIRMEYFDEALDAGLLPIVTIDPINPNTGDDRVWYPNQIVATGLAAHPMVTVTCDVSGGWGHSWAFPLEHYILDRVNNDQQTLRDGYMQPIDDLRKQLAVLLNQISNINSYQNIQFIPSRLSDPVADAQGNPQTIQVLPSLTVPQGANASAATRTKIDFGYASAKAAYIGAVNRLAGVLRQYGAFYNRFTFPIAVRTWDGNIDSAQYSVLKNLGQGKGFMVLATYKLHAIPDWARQDMEASLEAAITSRLLQMNLGRMASQLSGGSSSGDGYALAYQLITAEAAIAAPEIAAEMLAPWPYEISPPDDRPNRDPEIQGMSRADRLQWFTLLAAVQGTAANSPRLLLPKVFGSTQPLTAYAQAEAFNWNEFNPAWGGNDHYDEVNMLPFYIFTCSPRCWRLCSQGGWAWQPHLTYANALSSAMANNPSFSDVLSKAGFTGTDAASLETLNTH